MVGVPVSHSRPSEITVDESTLRSAVNSGDLSVVKQCLESGLPANLRDSKGISVLMLAAEKGLREIAEALLSLGADPNIADDYDDVPLNRAAAGGHVEIVRLLAEHGALVHSPSIGITPLLTAAGQGHLAVVQYLVEEQKVPVDGMSRHLGSPLQAAACEGHLDVVRYLLNKGARPDSRDSYGKTAIDIVRDCMSLSGLSDDELTNLRAMAHLLDSWTEGGASTPSAAGVIPKPDSSSTSTTRSKWWQLWRRKE